MRSLHWLVNQYTWKNSGIRIVLGGEHQEAHFSTKALIPTEGSI